jgi:hypothetical protein
MHGDSTQVIVGNLDFSCVKTGPDLQSKSLDCLAYGQ